jgi:dimethylamine monooxygenase subunit A
MTQDWSRLFSASGFRWQMGLRAGDARAFFAPTPANREILAERNHLLNETPGEYAALLDAGRPLLEEMRGFAATCGAVDSAKASALEALGRVLEPDFVLLQPSTDGPVVVGGVVCFPSSWSLPEKIGLTLAQTHAPVPLLNEQLAARVRTALDRLPSDAAWERDNWGLSRDGDRNHHPKRPRKRLDQTVEPNDVWLRVERQILYRLPQTGGILFGIRLEITPWRELAQIEEALAGLRCGLESMPADIAAYKGLASARSKILSWLPG